VRLCPAMFSLKILPRRKVPKVKYVPKEIQESDIARVRMR